MASAFTHGIAGAALGAVCISEPMPTRFWVLAVVLAILPDADALGFYLGVPYGSLFGHRGFTHSLFFALLMGILATTLFFDHPLFSKKWLGLVMCFTLIGASHAVLDAMTTGGMGVAFFSPFDTTRYFFPWRPIQVSPIGITSFFSTRGVQVLISEFLWVWIPSAVLVLIAVLRRKGTS